MIDKSAAILASLRIVAVPPGEKPPGVHNPSKAMPILESTEADYFSVLNLDELAYQLAPPEQRALMRNRIT